MTTAATAASPRAISARARAGGTGRVSQRRRRDGWSRRGSPRGHGTSSVQTGAVPSLLDPDVAAQLKRDAAGLVCAVVVEDTTSEVLMVAWMDDDALARTLSTGRAWYFSRSRGEPWRKGDTSGNVQRVVSVALDCDGDAVLVRVHQSGPACHTGARTCFEGRELSVAAPADAQVTP